MFGLRIKTKEEMKKERKQELKRQEEEQEEHRNRVPPIKDTYMPPTCCGKKMELKAMAGYAGYGAVEGFQCKICMRVVVC